ncbi:thymidylate kinase, putative [Perkinsus marinus ATCC 50983]|uniref:Thymidylate kinase n=1 Tax=Perkinsus marinus (strain ATCC 50983 / TXsc) TaxID=423536 RepID=C5KB73_PERM5|nr:thymidylate kinase, putative [Perkinsus marinus ATCC 50983]EER18399.1 thymidylate kinase, putative [Perkinsus marinus ATCC 50983]|eukprot:XP_002786603.1 thymidylate kinase, putative [Perkinsus marinus ATCC 50983]
MARGAFIVLEGLDRSGKSTQLRRISEALRQRTGKEVVEMGFPRRSSAIGKMLDTYLRDSSSKMRDEAVHLLFSANRWEAMSEMLSHLAAGRHIVCDRYIFSGVAYTAMKGTVDFEWCKSVDVGLPKPDLVVFLDLSPEAAAKRGAYGEERYEKEDLQMKVRTMYTKFEKEPFWRIFDADRPAEEVTRTVTDAAVAVAQALEKDNAMSIDKIWWPKETNLTGEAGKSSINLESF